MPLKSGTLGELQRLHSHDTHPGWQRRGGEGTRHIDISFEMSMNDIQTFFAGGSYDNKVGYNVSLFIDKMVNPQGQH